MRPPAVPALWWGMTSLTPARSYWPAVACGFAILAIGLGVRQSFGIFLKPVSAELHVGREVFSLGTAISTLLMDIFPPMVGRLPDLPPGRRCPSAASRSPCRGKNPRGR